MIELISVYDVPVAEKILYDLLIERTPEQSISHKEMPSYEQHQAFVRSQPYLAWYLIEEAEIIYRDGASPYAAGIESGPVSYVGSVYLTRLREVGIFVFEQYKHSGYGTKALAEIRRLHPGRILANINPTNTESRLFFQKHGAKLIQLTYELE